MMKEQEVPIPESLYRQITQALQWDPGARGLLSGPVPNYTEALLAQLKKLERAVLLTGFPVRCLDGRVAGESDGPLGIANIAWALEESGIEVEALSDSVCFPQLAAAMAARGCRTLPRAVPDSGQRIFFRNLLADFSPSHIITLERPGKAGDGHFYNMRGGVIDAMISDTDSIMEEARNIRAAIISVGDGGNELGMGALRPLVSERVFQGARICGAASADVAVISGVSNWWGWGIAAFCSLIQGKNLLPSPETEQKMLQALIASGGADGCTGLREETVDGLPLDVHLSVLEKVDGLVREALSK